MNRLHAKLLRRNISRYLQFISFFYSDIAQVVKIRPHECRERQGRPCLLHLVNIMASDDLATQGASALAAMIFFQLNRDNSVPAP